MGDKQVFRCELQANNSNKDKMMCKRPNLEKSRVLFGNGIWKRGQSWAFATNRHPGGHCESEVEPCCQVGEREALRAVGERTEVKREEGTRKTRLFPGAEDTYMY